MERKTEFDLILKRRGIEIFCSSGMHERDTSGDYNWLKSSFGSSISARKVSKRKRVN